MTRSVPPWVGATDDTKIPTRVKIRIIENQEGKCACGCGVKLGMAGEPIEFDHRVALINGGINGEENIQALRGPCHAVKTKQDVAEKSATARKKANHLGLKQSRFPLPCGRKSEHKRRIGEYNAVRRDK